MAFFLSQRGHPMAPLFQLVNEIDRAATYGPSCGPPFAHCKPRRCGRSNVSQVKTPKFNMHENPTSFELTGELPGYDQSEVAIDWADEHTLRVQGRQETSAPPRSGPTDSNEEAYLTAETGVKEIKEDLSDTVSVAASEDSTNYHAPTVEDEDADNNSPAGQQATNEKYTSKGKEPVDLTSPLNPKPVSTSERQHSRTWLHERSGGNFQRTFNFPASVHLDHDSIQASMRNGLLTIHVPKAAPRQFKQIVIN